MRLILVFLSILVLLASCAHEKRADVDTTDASNAAEKKAEIYHAERASAQFLYAGDFQKALDAYKEVYRKYHRDGRVLKGISGVVEEIREKADAAYKKGDFAFAGRLCRVLLKNGQLKGPKGASFFDVGAVTTCLADCRDRLTRKGLEYYRRGELKRAVATWQNVLEFDPDNMEVRKAVDTTSVQLRNMR